MKKLYIFLTALAILNHTLPALATNEAPTIRIVSHDNTTAIIEVKKPNQIATFPAQLINTYGNNVSGLNLDGCALIDTTAQAFITMPLWAANSIKSALGNSTYGVLSPSGKLYTNLGFTKGGSGWTPGFLTYSNYLGSASITAESDMPGAANLVNICNGACQK